MFDIEEETHHVSSLLGPDGQPIVYEIKSQKQGFMGFIDFRDYADPEGDF